MPRKPRIEYPGAVYHVISRGNRQDVIVRDDHDRRRFVETMGEVCERMGWRLHAWVLMPNHYHWLLETPEANLVQGMQWFQTTWSTRFRVRHGLRGHVLQGRYKAFVVDPTSDRYFQSISSYIHLNPVRARGLLASTQQLSAYAWSSYPSFLAPRRKRPDWLEVQRVLGNLTLRDDSAGRRAYRVHMEEYVAEVRGDRGAEARNDAAEEWRELRDGWCFGGSDFHSAMLERVGAFVEGKQANAYNGAMVREYREKRAEALLERGMTLLGLSWNELEALKKTDERKQVLAWLVRRHTSVRNRWVCEKLRMGHEVNVSQSVRRVAEDQDQRLVTLRRRITKALRSKD
jgi:REP element-mobilizing transposase RayT